MNLFGLTRRSDPGPQPHTGTDSVSLPSTVAPGGPTLARHPVGSTVVLAAPHLGPAATRRLAELGLRAGTEVVILHRTAGRGRVVATGTTRIALDRATVAAWPAEAQR
ncbi:ferrous iron transport protein A [Intrasporangium calvum]|uniref:Ferrous iron transport protein A n=1 Tax=Intrasporangium calvum TaxID=53358 RepID=A0ABT5GHE6_9MICO|nr:FeoA family protein [Intrasporangium calvum]MDC5697671.1 ferrous iron transport protein A [Intrasporangium calvum]